MSEPSSASATREQRFVASLQELVTREQRAVLATLRRGLTRPPGEDPETYPYVVPFLPDQPRPRQEAAYFLVAGLFALWHQGSTRQTPTQTSADLGAALAEVRAQQAHERGQQPEAGDSLERRFVALLSSEWSALPYHLRQLVNLLRSREVPIDWLQLLGDLQRWDDPHRSVQRRWARSFWRVPAGEPDTPTPSTASAQHEAQPSAQE